MSTIVTDNHTRYLPGEHPRARFLRLDAATILKRFYLCERALIISQSAWLAGIAPLEAKMTLPRFTWQDTLTAHALRERVFELRYPRRMMETGDDAPLIEIFDESINAPSAQAFMLALRRVYKPALLSAYRSYVDCADDLSDGPILRALNLAIEEKEAQIAWLAQQAKTMSEAEPEQRREAAIWASALEDRLSKVGGLTLDLPRQAPAANDLPGRRPFQLAEVPARDPRFHLCHYYWPDIVDPKFAYGEGINLQLRSGVSHLNEVWAVETGGAILHAFADDLDWEYVYDAARWTYDESRHVLMGYERLREWGFELQEMPLGSYIYDSAAGQEPIIRLGMLHYFETKNIGNKVKRAEAFGQYLDRMSQHDMEFDWADETIHAAYGKRWHTALHEKFPDRIPDMDGLHRRCDELVADEIAAATDAERADIRQVADAMIAKAGEVGLSGTAQADAQSKAA